ncbi:MAG: FHA domain-containing protein [Blautia sp.]|nr:FHA domain-containing protein [Blautia sp.]MCM1199921.1 FHA domain-containing protein [Bacteroides fragilis]
MIEATYFKDYQHNYLILKCRETEAGENYRSRMLVSGKIDRILKCSVRHINGEAYFYYDISSRVTMENLYRGKKLSYEQVRDFFRQMDMICRTLTDFFMDEAGLLARPDSIYYDLSSAKYFGLYYPGKAEPAENPYEQLMEFLLRHTDSDNRALADILYRIYEMSGESCFSMADALALFEEEEDVLETEAVLEECLTERISGGVEEEPKESGRDREEDGEEEEKSGMPRSGREKNTVFYGVFAALSLCGTGGAVWLYLHFTLTERETLLLIGCLAVMGLCFLFSVIQLLLSGRKSREKDQEDEALIWDIEDEFREERPVAVQDVLDRSMGISMNRENRGTAACQEKPETQYSETVFIDTRKQKAENKLYSLDKKNKKHIVLTQFPFSIGKMPGCVDCVLTDASISRLHARIEKQGEKVLLTDMNSTNGTYKNGLRMEPSETVEIEPGDEIRFGKLNYCYR